MADASRIEWTDATWNPIRARNLVTGKLGWHCTHVSEGCRYCYAEPINRRLGTGLDFKPQLLGRAERPPGEADRRRDHERVEVFLDEAMLRAPLRWKKPRRIFVGSMSDLFGEFVTDAMLDRIFAVMALCPQHTFQVLTKRATRMRSYFARIRSAQTVEDCETDVVPALFDQIACDLTDSPCAAGAIEEVPWPLPNVWLGVSAEDQSAADERIPELQATPAAVRFVSAEPLLGPIDLRLVFTCDKCGAIPEKLWVDGAPTLPAPHGRCPACFVGTLLPPLDWVIVGGESGPHARPMHPDWARQIRDACAAAGTAFFFKQWGEWAPGGPETYGNLNAVHRVGKKAAGRLLDGVEHNAMPAAR